MITEMNESSLFMRKHLCFQICNTNLGAIKNDFVFNEQILL